MAVCRYTHVYMMAKNDIKSPTFHRKHRIRNPCYGLKSIGVEPETKYIHIESALRIIGPSYEAGGLRIPQSTIFEILCCEAV